jgi:hypothetical protein
MLVTVIRMLGEIAPVEVIYTVGNHDRVTGRMCMRTVEATFTNDDNISFDSEPMPQKVREIGIALVGFEHGDSSAKNQSLWIQDKFREAYGRAKIVEVHSGHFHTNKEKEFIRVQEGGGVTQRSQPTICAASYWENQRDYPLGEKMMQSYLWNDQHGLREVWISTI